LEDIVIEFDALIIKEEEGGFSSLCIDLDVASQGETVEEAKQMLAEAVEGYLEVSIENSLSILRKVPDSDNPEFTDPENIVERFKIKTELKIHSYA
jgi:predicted RNase H-like HicB family nuclease